MTFEGAEIREQNASFAIVVVKSHVINDTSRARDCAANFGRYFPGRPVILMAQDGRGRPTYWGRPDIVRFLASISMNRIPWQKYQAS